MLGTYDSLPSSFQITGRPNGAVDILHSYTPIYWSVSNFYSDGTKPDRILPGWSSFFIDDVEVNTPTWEFDFHDQNSFPEMDAPFAPIFSESDYTAVGFQFEDDYVLSINSTTVQIVPIPAAFWLFGSAFGLLGWVRRKKYNFF